MTVLAALPAWRTHALSLRAIPLPAEATLQEAPAPAAAMIDDHLLDLVCKARLHAAQLLCSADHHSLKNPLERSAATKPGGAAR